MESWIRTVMLSENFLKFISYQLASKPRVAWAVCGVQKGWLLLVIVLTQSTNLYCTLCHVKILRWLNQFIFSKKKLFNLKISILRTDFHTWLSLLVRRIWWFNFFIRITYPFDSFVYWICEDNLDVGHSSTPWVANGELQFAMTRWT